MGRECPLHRLSLFLVIIRLVAHSDLLLLNLAKLFAVNVYPGRHRRWSLPDDLGHCTEKMGGAEQDGWIALLFHVIQKELRVPMALLCSLVEPILG